MFWQLPLHPRHRRSNDKALPAGLPAPRSNFRVLRHLQVILFIMFIQLFGAFADIWGRKQHSKKADVRVDNTKFM